MNITLAWIVAGLMASGEHSVAKVTGQEWRLSWHAQSDSSDACSVVGVWSGSRVEKSEEVEDSPSGQFMFGITFSVSHTLLFIKGNATKESPMKIQVRIAPFIFLYIIYWEFKTTEDQTCQCF